MILILCFFLLTDMSFIGIKKFVKKKVLVYFMLLSKYLIDPWIYV